MSMELHNKILQERGYIVFASTKLRKVGDVVRDDTDPGRHPMGVVGASTEEEFINQLRTYRPEGLADLADMTRFTEAYYRVVAE